MIWKYPEHSGESSSKKKNAMTSSMYITVAEFLEDAAKDDQIGIMRLHHSSLTLE